jgi:ankyrin repeat protein
LTRREIAINYDLIRFLVENGANKTITTLKGKTAYDLSEKHCNREQIRKLLTAQAPLLHHLRPLAIPLREINGQYSSKKDNKRLLPKKGNSSSNAVASVHRRTRSLASYFVLCQK